MKLKKADEMEQYQSNKSAKITYMFFTIALLVWSLLNYFTKGQTGWEFAILLMGNVVFFGSRVYFGRKMR
ncbi:hypothetical protein [Paenibacillus puerhi]|uniref:hypothetical protein n=1 Tax=Paenibacillus puerhi TaxID=2692622 RepID=UPI00135B7CD7|nr:hypothetical protein [Paenibacillus puerhi]